VSLAICIRCGNQKGNAIRRCPICGFKPQTDEEKAKSLILSLDYEINGEYRGKTKQELVAIGQTIRIGKPYAFDPQEVSQVVNYAKSVISIPPRVLMMDFVKWVGPPVVILLIVFLILWANK
jgi:hypothetical protein